MADRLDEQVSFKPLRWYIGTAAEMNIRAGMALELASETQDIARGTALVVELLERDAVEREVDGPGPFLDAYDTGVLVRLAARNLHMLADRAQSFIADREQQCIDAARPAPSRAAGA